MSHDGNDSSISIGRYFISELDEDDIKNTNCDPLGTLMRAVLIKAVEDFQKGGMLKREAVRYLFTDTTNDGEYLFSFFNVCESLKLNPMSVRAKILSLSKKVRLHRRVA